MSSQTGIYSNTIRRDEAAEADAPKRPAGEVTKALDRLEKAAISLGEQVAHLEDRITPVLRSQAPGSTTAESGPAQPSRCDIAERIDNIIARLDRVTMHVANISGRVDI